MFHSLELLLLLLLLLLPELLLYLLLHRLSNLHLFQPNLQPQPRNNSSSGF